MYRTYKYRLYPNKPEARLLVDLLETCRQLYNRILAARRDAWQQDKRVLTTRDTQALLPAWKREDPRLKMIYSQVLQDVNERVGGAFDGFFRRVRAEATPGYPRFKPKGRYDSFTYPQYQYTFKTKSGETRCGHAFDLVRENGTDYLYLAKIGRVKIILHRPLSGTIKTLTVQRTRTGKWYASIVCEVAPEIRPLTGLQVGIDLGLYQYMALSDGTIIPNPRFFRQEEHELTKVQRRYQAVLNQCQPYWAKGQPPPPKLQRERKRRGKALCCVHERIANRRENFCQQISRRLVDAYDVLVLEKLDAQRMSETRQHGLNKSIRDAAWKLMQRLIAFKAVEAGKQYREVNPYHTSQLCSGCGQLVKKSRSVRVHVCPGCGLVLDRDVNAARNILALGLQGGGNQSPEAPPA